jgi:membrane dipeptidase
MPTQTQIRPAAAELHRDALVMDSLSPDMAGFAPAMIQRLGELIDSGSPSHLIWLAMKDMADDLLLAGSYPEYWQWWDSSGVDVASVTMGGFGPDPFSFNAVVSDVARWIARFDRLGGRLRKVIRGSDARDAHAAGAHGVILNLQNSEHIEGDLGKLAVLHNLGIRIIQLTYNTRTLAGDGFAERNPAGLSKFGVDLVRRMNELGLLVDTSHCSEPTTLDAIRVSDAPVAVTHAFATAVSGHPRGSPTVSSRKWPPMTATSASCSCRSSCVPAAARRLATSSSTSDTSCPSRAPSTSASAPTGAWNCRRR